MIIYKAYKFRMYPNIEQIITLNKFLGSTRFIYNYFLDQKDKRYKELNINYKLKDMCSDLKLLYNEYPWLKEIDSCALRTTLFNLDDAYTRFFKKQTEHPRFKNRNSKNSYRTNCIRSSYKDNNYSNIKVDLINRTIKLPKLDEITIKGYRNLNNFDDKKIINATISKVANKYYVSVLVEEDIEVKEYILRYAIGIDLGVKNIISTSDGIKYKAMSNIKRIEKKLKGLNRCLARSIKGSNNRRKIINKIQRVNEKLRNMRKYYIHLITTNIVKENDLIVTEDLKVKDMIINSNKNLNKLITNTSMSEIIRQLEYKTKWSNKRLIKVDTYYPSSQICNRCGNINKELKDLSIREYKCSKCGNTIDRDINASINILFEGITKYYKEQYNN